MKTQFYTSVFFVFLQKLNALRRVMSLSTLPPRPSFNWYINDALSLTPILRNASCIQAIQLATYIYQNSVKHHRLKCSLSQDCVAEFRKRVAETQYHMTWTKNGHTSVFNFNKLSFKTLKLLNCDIFWSNLVCGRHGDSLKYPHHHIAYVNLDYRISRVTITMANVCQHMYKRPAKSDLGYLSSRLCTTTADTK